MYSFLRWWRQLWWRNGDQDGQPPCQFVTIIAKIFAKFDHLSPSFTYIFIVEFSLYYYQKNSVSILFTYICGMGCIYCLITFIHVHTYKNFIFYLFVYLKKYTDYFSPHFIYRIKIINKQSLPCTVTSLCAWTHPKCGSSAETWQVKRPSVHTLTLRKNTVLRPERESWKYKKKNHDTMIDCETIFNTTRIVQQNFAVE